MKMNLLLKEKFIMLLILNWMVRLLLKRFMLKIKFIMLLLNNIYKI